MTRAAAVLLLALTACVETRSVAVTFGPEGEGLDGFMCKDEQGQSLLTRLSGERRASLVVDFVRLGGVPGCRTGQLVKWCATHDCVPLQHTRSCLEVTLPPPHPDREVLRGQLLESLRAAGAWEALANAPDEFVLVRVVGTAQRCEALLPVGTAPLPAFDKAQLVGCAYSCPVLLDKVEQDVYLGFETFVGECAQGVRICSDGQLAWQP